MKDDNFSLIDKTILVTGATSGIGFEICKQIAIAGGNFIGIGRNIEKLQQYIEDQKLEASQVVKFDLIEIENIHLIVAELPIKIDGFVHSAGIAHVSPMHFFNYADYETVRKINLDSVLVLFTELLKKKKINKNASVVFISSISSIRGAKGNGLYAITKAALDSISKVYANELSSKHIRVNTIQPGMVETEMSKQAENILSKELMDIDRSKYPLGYGEPIDIALPVVFLLSNASKWITGQSIVIDGGRTSLL
ncbi:SDR family oxidoreductase [Flavobacterium paronense]|uniref:SDR family NAD(P)-dependent oxidoreductase n=1 Tax=Flavobacterium paronense TaxID=1392775 RepID=A0ABV5GFG4_9FLAO|nr:SDR family oxidoreductase [Flavobacterium paronense]MDN3676036.1 SDR family oxidoreductase [Flavobacterium paronense]